MAPPSPQTADFGPPKNPPRFQAEMRFTPCARYESRRGPIRGHGVANPQRHAGMRKPPDPVGSRGFPGADYAASLPSF